MLFEMSLREYELLAVSVSVWILAGLGVLLLVGVVMRYLAGAARTSLEIDEAVLGIGNQKITLRPNREDRQIAFMFWTELRTRKLGLEVTDEDVIVEVYDSWHSFFQTSRSLIREIPISKIESSDVTREILRLTLVILNDELRPHLTTWQAQFRWWWTQQLEEGLPSGTPQELQRRYDKYGELVSDLRRVNRKLVAYTDALGRLAGVPIDDRAVE